MTDARPTLERARANFPDPPLAMEDVLRLRDRRQRNRRIRAGVLGVVVAVAMALGGLSLLRSTQRPATPSPSPLPPLRDQVIAFADGSEVKTIRADGSHEAVLATPCTGGSCHIDGIAWSPSGSELAIGLGHGNVANGQTMIVRRDGSGLRTLPGCPGGVPAWSPDGSLIAPGNESGPEPLYTCDADGGGVRQVSPEWLRMDFDMAWSPDGRELAYSARTPAGNDAIVVESADGTGARRIFRRAWHWIWGTAWSPDGRRIAFTVQGQLHEATQLWVVNADGTDPHVVLEARFVGSPVWSPDGTQLAVLMGSDRTHRSLVLVAADGSGQTQLLEGSSISNPVWDPSGRALALLHDHDLVLVPVDGSPVQTVASGLAQMQIAWAPIGRRTAT